MAKELQFTFPYLYDESQTVARALPFERGWPQQQNKVIAAVDAVFEMLPPLLPRLNYQIEKWL